MEHHVRHHYVLFNIVYCPSTPLPHLGSWLINDPNKWLILMFPTSAFLTLVYYFFCYSLFLLQFSPQSYWYFCFCLLIANGIEPWAIISIENPCIEFLPQYHSFLSRIMTIDNLWLVKVTIRVSPGDMFTVANSFWPLPIGNHAEYILGCEKSVN